MTAKSVKGRCDSIARRQDIGGVFRFPENPLADSICPVINQAVNGLNAQVGHADVIGIRVN